MTIAYEGQRAGEYLVSELDRRYSRDEATLASGEKHVDGDILVLSGSKLYVLDAITDFDTAEALTGALAGIAWGDVDASATGANADILKVPYVARGAVVREAYLNLPADAQKKAAVLAALAAVNPKIVVVD